jgi:methanogenic corrinoid protein MtbC1
MVSDVLEIHGWDVRYLGSNTPPSGVVTTLMEAKADVLGVAATMLFDLPQARRLIASVRAELGHGVRVIVGGAAFRHRGAGDVGADLFAADLRETVALLCGDGAAR